MHITWFNDLTLVQMQERASRMAPKSAIFWFLLSEDAAGIPYTEDRALETMREVSAVPIFGMGDYQMGRGIVGGPLMQTKALGLQGADAALANTEGREARRSTRHLCCSGRQPMTAGNWSVGASVKLDCCRAALCIFVSRPFGISIVGLSSPSRRLSRCSRS